MLNMQPFCRLYNYWYGRTIWSFVAATMRYNAPTLCRNLQSEFDDTKGVIRIRISKKNRQHNGRKKKYKRTNDDLQSINIKLKIEYRSLTCMELGPLHIRYPLWSTTTQGCADLREPSPIPRVIDCDSLNIRQDAKIKYSIISFGDTLIHDEYLDAYLLYLDDSNMHRDTFNNHIFYILTNKNNAMIYIKYCNNKIKTTQRKLNNGLANTMKNTTLSEQFYNQIEKSQQETQIDTLT